MPFDAKVRIGDAGELEVVSFFWGASQAGTDGERDARVQDFFFVKRVDSASPLLFAACCEGAVVGDAVFALRPSGDEGPATLRYLFRDVRVASIRPGGNSQGKEDLPLEEVALAFSRCEIEYVGKRTTRGGWDLERDART